MPHTCSQIGDAIQNVWETLRKTKDWKLYAAFNPIQMNPRIALYMNANYAEGFTHFNPDYYFINQVLSHFIDIWDSVVNYQLKVMTSGRVPRFL